MLSAQSGSGQASRNWVSLRASPDTAMNEYLPFPFIELRHTAVTTLTELPDAVTRDCLRQNVPTGPADHFTSYWMGNRSKTGGMMLISHVYVAPKLRMSGAVPLFHLHCFLFGLDRTVSPLTVNRLTGIVLQLQFVGGQTAFHGRTPNSSHCIIYSQSSDWPCLTHKIKTFLPSRLLLQIKAIRPPLL